MGAAHRGLGPGAGSLDEHAVAQIDTVQRHGRIAEVETWRRKAADLAHQQRAGDLRAQRQRLLDCGDQHDLARTCCKRVRCGSEGADHIDHHYRTPRSGAVVQPGVVDAHAGRSRAKPSSARVSHARASGRRAATA